MSDVEERENVVNGILRDDESGAVEDDEAEVFDFVHCKMVFDVFRCMFAVCTSENRRGLNFFSLRPKIN